MKSLTRRVCASIAQHSTDTDLAWLSNSSQVQCRNSKFAVLRCESGLALHAAPAQQSVRAYPQLNPPPKPGHGKSFCLLSGDHWHGMPTNACSHGSSLLLADDLTLTNQWSRITNDVVQALEDMFGITQKGLTVASDACSDLWRRKEKEVKSKRQMWSWQGEESFEAVPNSDFIVSRTAHRNNTSNYYIGSRKSNFSEVTDLLKGKGIDLDNNRFLILQVRPLNKCCIFP